MLPFKVALIALLLVPLSSSYETISNNGKSYAYEDGPETDGHLYDHEQTETWCKGLGGLLPSVHSQADIVFIHSLIIKYSSKGYVFLGGRVTDRKWRWDDGTPMDFGNITTDACFRDYPSPEECSLAVVAYTGRSWDRTIVQPWKPYALSRVRLCQMPALVSTTGAPQTP